MFSTFSIFILERGSAGKTKLPRSAQIAALLSVAAALLCKEIYVAVLPPVLLLYSWRFRERALGIATVVIVCGYIVYRDWMIGPAFAYNMPFLRPGQYLAFLAKLPYTISANDGGYLICGILLVLVVLFYRGGTKHSVSILLGFLALFAFSLAAVFPVSLPLYGTVRLPGTWYRIVFIPHTIALICLGYLTVRSVSRRIRTAIAVILLVVLLPGLDKTRRFWVERTTSAEREGKFYLQNPDKVLLSEQEAWWFIPGIQAMYNVSPPHYVFAKDLQNGQAIPPTVWRFRNGQFVPQDSQ
jgi:hypothetical protein